MKLLSKRVRAISAICMSIMLMMTGCGGADIPEDRLAIVYYLDSSGERIVSEEYELQSDINDIAAVITELIHTLEKNGSADTLTNPIEPDIEFEEIKLKESDLSIYFTGAYNNKSGLKEILSRACIVKTMCQLDGVDRVEFFVEDQPLIVGGESVGLMDTTTFVENLGNEGEPQTRTVKLYFADETGQKLIPVNTKVTYPAAEKMAKLLIDCLIAGPESVTDQDIEGLIRTVPSDTILNNVTIRDYICYIDVSREFGELLPNVTSDVTVYSIVNTLCELPSISRVQFTINSSVRSRYGETADFNKSFERNLDIIAEGRE